MRKLLSRPTRPALFAILMAAAALVALLPARWTSFVNGLLQPGVWLSGPASQATRAVRSATDAAPPAPDPAEFEELLHTKELLERQLHHQELMIAEMDRLLAEVTGLRDQLVDPNARIIIAPVVGADASARREVLLIGKGSRAGVRVGDWVAAGAVTGVHPGARTARDRLLQQWLVGRVVDVAPYVAWVQLTTDPQFGRMAAWAADASADGTWRIAERQCVLYGVGDGLMRIEQATVDYRQTGQIFVLVPIGHPRPMALLAGVVVGGRMLETGLHFDLDVRPPADARRLSYVYVISLTAQQP